MHPLIVIPEKYYESLEMVVKDVEVGKVRALCIKKLNAHSAISGRDEKIFKKLLSSMEFVPIWNQSNIPYLTLFCSKMEWMEHYTRLRRSEPFLNYHTFVGMKVDIYPQLRKRVHDVFNSVFEKGITGEYRKRILIDNAQRAGISKSKMFTCRSISGIIRYNEKRVSIARELDLAATGIVFKFLLFISFITFILLYLEFCFNN